MQICLLLMHTWKGCVQDKAHALCQLQTVEWAMSEWSYADPPVQSPSTCGETVSSEMEGRGQVCRHYAIYSNELYHGGWKRDWGSFTYWFRHRSQPWDRTYGSALPICKQMETRQDSWGHLRWHEAPMCGQVKPAPPQYWHRHVKSLWAEQIWVCIV